MGIGAIVLGVLALVCALAGALLAWVPFLGTMLSFLAPVLALAGTILGGVALSRAKAGGGESESLAIGGLVTSLVALLPAMLVALTCGACNVCTTAMYLDPELGAVDAGPYAADAGVLRNGTPPPHLPQPYAQPGVGTPTSAPGMQPQIAPNQTPPPSVPGT